MKVKQVSNLNLFAVTTTTNYHKPPENNHKLPVNDQKPVANNHRPQTNNRKKPSSPFPNSNSLIFFVN